MSASLSSEVMRVSLDLVATAGQNIGFLRDVAESHWLDRTPVLVEAIRRYDKLWMPMVSQLTPESGMILPPLDIEWIWFCHTLDPVVYRQYCESRFLKLIGKSAIFSQGNRDDAVEKCREIWVAKYPSEPFENESDSGDLNNTNILLQTDYLLDQVSKQRYLFTKFFKPYMLELVYLIAAKNRYIRFLSILQRFPDSCLTFAPTSDILLMWITHKSHPTAYALDVKEMEGSMEKVTGSEESVNEEDLELMKQLWERVFDQPYEKSGCPVIGGSSGGDGLKRPPIHWEITEIDANIKYQPLLPRFLLEVSVFVKTNLMRETPKKSEEFLRFQLLKCHRDLKVNKPTSSIPPNSWQKTVHLYCELGTQGMVVELKGIWGGSKTFMWNELLREPSSTSDGVVGAGRARILASITPPAQAPYLLKCVPDWVTDDSGSMVSEVVLKMNRYRPQEGRWLSRTVLDHAGRECFVIRMRVGGGFWRRGSDKPTVVKWEDRCVEILEGTWSYIGGPIGEAAKAPEKVIATATPKAPSQGWDASWSFSTGHELFIRSRLSTTTTTTTTAGMSFNLKTSTSTESQVRLVRGRKMQYEHLENDNEEEGFVTLIRFTEENPDGRATGLLNWKLSAVEFLPEEDAAFVLLLSTTILRSVTAMRREDVGSLLIRRRLKQAKHGDRDWGSVIVLDGSVNSAHVRPWYRNVKVVMAPLDYAKFNYSAEECSDEFYKQALYG